MKCWNSRLFNERYFKLLIYSIDFYHFDFYHPRKLFKKKNQRSRIVISMNEENFSFFASSIFQEKIKKKLNNETLSILISLIRFIPSLSSIASTPSYTWQLLSPPKLTNEFHSILNSTRLLFSEMVGSPWKKKYIGWKPSRMMFCST